MHKLLKKRTKDYIFQQNSALYGSQEGVPHFWGNYSPAPRLLLIHPRSSSSPPVSAYSSDPPPSLHCLSRRFIVSPLVDLTAIASAASTTNIRQRFALFAT